MPKRLTEDQINHYRAHGYCYPVPVLSRPEYTDYRSDLERYETEIGAPLDFPEKV